MAPRPSRSQPRETAPARGAPDGVVPICDAKGAPIGAVTKVGDDVRKVMELMRSERVSRVMVCDAQGKLVGAISLQDLAQESEDDAGETLQDVKSDGPPAVH